LPHPKIFISIFRTQSSHIKTTTFETTSVDDTIPQQPPKDFPQIGILRSASIHPSPNPRPFNIVRNATFSHPSPKLSNNLKTSENIKVPLLGKATEKKKVFLIFLIFYSHG